MQIKEKMRMLRCYVYQFSACEISIPKASAPAASIDAARVRMIIKRGVVMFVSLPLAVARQAAQMGGRAGKDGGSFTRPLAARGSAFAPRLSASRDAAGSSLLSRPRLLRRAGGEGRGSVLRYPTSEADWCGSCRDRPAE